MTRLSWEKTFALFCKPDCENMGSAGWMVAPSNVKIFIESCIRSARADMKQEILEALPKLLDAPDNPLAQYAEREKMGWNSALREARKNIEKLT